MLRKEATSLQHLLTHNAYNTFCQACVQANSDDDNSIDTHQSQEPPSYFRGVHGEITALAVDVLSDCIGEDGGVHTRDATRLERTPRDFAGDNFIVESDSDGNSIVESDSDDSGESHNAFNVRGRQPTPSSRMLRSKSLRISTAAPSRCYWSAVAVVAVGRR